MTRGLAPGPRKPRRPGVLPNGWDSIWGVLLGPPSRFCTCVGLFLNAVVLLMTIRARAWPLSAVAGCYVGLLLYVLVRDWRHGPSTRWLE